MNAKTNQKLEIVAKVVNKAERPFPVKFAPGGCAHFTDGKFYARIEFDGTAEKPATAFNAEVLQALKARPIDEFSSNSALKLGDYEFRPGDEFPDVASILPKDDEYHEPVRLSVEYLEMVLKCAKRDKAKWISFEFPKKGLKPSRLRYGAIVEPRIDTFYLMPCLPR